MPDGVPTEKVRFNLSIKGRRASLALETGVWDTLAEIRRLEETSLDGLRESIVVKAEGIGMASVVPVHGQAGNKNARPCDQGIHARPLLQVAAYTMEISDAFSMAHIHHSSPAVTHA